MCLLLHCNVVTLFDSCPPLPTDGVPSAGRDLYPPLHLPRRGYLRVSDHPTQLGRGACPWLPLLAIVLSLPRLALPSDPGSGAVSDRPLPLSLPGPGAARETPLCEQSGGGGWMILTNVRNKLYLNNTIQSMTFQWCVQTTVIYKTI